MFENMWLIVTVCVACRLHLGSLLNSDHTKELELVCGKLLPWYDGNVAAGKNLQVSNK